MHKHTENTHPSEWSAVSTQKFQGPELESLVCMKKNCSMQKSMQKKNWNMSPNEWWCIGNTA